MSVIFNAFSALGWGTTIQDILLEWERLGIFEYVLPALLIFAVVFGILMKSNVLGDNKGVNVVVSLAAALLAMQSFALRSFFRIIWPYAGIGLAILLVALILTGLFQTETNSNWWTYTFFGIGMFVAVVVVISSLSSYDWVWGSWLQENWAGLATLVVIGLLVTLVTVSSNKNKNKTSG